MAKLNVNYCGVDFSNPFILPSGIFSEKVQYSQAIKSGAAAITWKSLTCLLRDGNPLPRVWKYDCGVINSVGLRNPGIDAGISEIAKYQKDNPTYLIIVSLFATKVKEFVTLVEKAMTINPKLIELNLSCPNVDDEFGKPLGMEKGAAGEIVKAVKKVSGKIPVLAKLSPNVTNIGEIAKVCEENGADGIVAINTVGPGMIIDINKRKPVLGALRGGVSGPGILPVTVRCVYDIYEAVKIPIIGMGGISKWQDTVEIVMAGATLVGIGSATYTKGLKVYDQLKKELSDYMDKNNIKDIKELVGVAHHK